MTRSVPRKPTDESALFNPAFLSLIARRVVEGFHEEQGGSTPLPIIHLAVTMSLNPIVRERLTMRITTNLAQWLNDNPRVVSHLPHLAVGLAPYINDAIIFSLANSVLTVAPPGLALGEAGPTKSIRGPSDEIVACQRAARYLGRWLSSSGPVHTVLALVGVRP
jgi:hypothetical protein